MKYIERIFLGNLEFFKCGISPNLQEDAAPPLAERNEGHGSYVVQRQGQQTWKPVMYGNCIVTWIATN